MRLRREFRARLVSLYSAIDCILGLDDSNNAERIVGVLSALYSIFSYLWSKCPQDLIENFYDDKS